MPCDPCGLLLLVTLPVPYYLGYMASQGHLDSAIGSRATVHKAIALSFVLSLHVAWCSLVVGALAICMHAVCTRPAHEDMATSKRRSCAIQRAQLPGAGGCHVSTDCAARPVCQPHYDFLRLSTLKRRLG